MSDDDAPDRRTADDGNLHPVRLYRRRHDRMPLRELANRLDIDPSTLQRIETGNLNPGFDLMRRIIEVTDGEVTAEALLAWRPPPEPAAAA